jgi:hypothetical protein
VVVLAGAGAVLGDLLLHLGGTLPVGMIAGVATSVYASLADATTQLRGM